MVEAICQIHHMEGIEAEKKSDEDGKALYKLMNNVVYGKTMENSRNRIDVRLVSNETKLYVTKNIWQ